MAETYAGQFEHQTYEPNHMLPKLAKRIGGLLATKEQELSPAELYVLKNLADDGSWYAANFLVLAGEASPEWVGDQKYAYQSAKFIKSPNIALVLLTEKPELAAMIEETGLSLESFKPTEINPEFIADFGWPEESAS